MARVVIGPDIEAAEAELAAPFKIHLSDQSLAAPRMARAMVDSNAGGQYIDFHVGTLRKHFPEMDPRLEPSLRTMFLHYFLVGVICGRKAA